MVTMRRSAAVVANEARRRLVTARRAAYEHAAVCLLWDYEGNGGCATCDRHDGAVAQARAAYRRVSPAVGVPAGDAPVCGACGGDVGTCAYCTPGALA